MEEKRVCLYCGKENPVDSRNRPVLFCCKEHRGEYTKQKNIKYCKICGKPAKYYYKYGYWGRTCGSEECRREARRRAQKTAAQNREKIKFNKEEITDLYLTQNKTRKEVADYYNCSESHLKKFMRQNKIGKGYAQRVENMQKTKLERYGNKLYINAKKRKKTCLKKYGAPSNLCLYKGIRPRNSSKKEVAWIKSLSYDSIVQHHVIKIQLKKWVIVDGYDPKTNTIFEFLGDYWHGNPEVFKPNSINRSMHKRMKTLYKRTFDKFDMLKSLGYNVVYIWEKDYKEHKEPKTY